MSGVNKATILNSLAIDCMMVTVTILSVCCGQMRRRGLSSVWLLMKRSGPRVCVALKIMAVSCKVSITVSYTERVVYLQWKTENGASPAMVKRQFQPETEIYCMCLCRVV